MFERIKNALDDPITHIYLFIVFMLYPFIDEDMESLRILLYHARILFYHARILFYHAFVFMLMGLLVVLVVLVQIIRLNRSVN